MFIESWKTWNGGLSLKYVASSRHGCAFIEKPVTIFDPLLIQQDHPLLAWLFSAISPSLLPQITASRTSYEAWSTLEGIFNTRSKSRIIELQNQLRNLRKDALSVDEYFAKLTGISEELRKVGVIVDDGEAYDPFITAQTACVDDINFSTLLGLLRSYEAHLSRHTEARNVATTNAVQSSSSILVCQICEKRGHSALSCFHHHNEQHFPSNVDKSRQRFHYNNKASTTKESPAANVIWYPDSGVSVHVNSDPHCIQKSHQSSKSLTVANGNRLRFNQTGSSNFLLANKFIHLKEILLAPFISKNLLSLSKFCLHNSVSLSFDANSVYLKVLRSSNDEIKIGKVNGGLYEIHLEDHTPEANTYISVDLERWHKRLVHACKRATRRMIQCHNLPALELIYGAVWGPSSYLSTTGHRYYLFG